MKKKTVKNLELSIENPFQKKFEEVSKKLDETIEKGKILRKNKANKL